MLLSLKLQIILKIYFSIFFIGILHFLIWFSLRRKQDSLILWTFALKILSLSPDLQPQLLRKDTRVPLLTSVFYPSVLTLFLPLCAPSFHTLSFPRLFILPRER